MVYESKSWIMIIIIIIFEVLTQQANKRKNILLKILNFFLSVRGEGSHKGENFQFFFCIFLFRMIQFTKKKQKKKRFQKKFKIESRDDLDHPELIHNSRSRVFQNTEPLTLERQPFLSSKFPIIAKSLEPFWRKS